VAAIRRVLPAWGMHRMGTQAAKVGDFTTIVSALRQMTPALQELWPLRITTLSPEAAGQAAATTWDIIACIKVSTSQTQIVAGSKMLHHVLPSRPQHHHQQAPNCMGCWPTARVSLVAPAPVG
jgi:hypothetical protein